MDPVSLVEYEAAAKELLPPASFDWIAGGANDEITLAACREAFNRRVLRPHVMRDVSSCDLSLQLLGIDLPYPIIIAPTAIHLLANQEGEVATSRGAAKANALYTISTSASLQLEDIANAAPSGPRWFQLYHENRSHTESLIARAKSSGYKAIVLTVDLPQFGRRERDLRNLFALPDGVSMVMLPTGTVPRPVQAATSAWARGAHGTSATWDDLAWIKAASGLPLVLKGVLRGDDARQALEHGVDAIWVSNHGGRQLDGAIASLDALPEIIEAVAGRCPVILDGGVRRGTDVLKALALGATAVAVGRPVFWGLAVGGEAGVERVLRLLRDELDLAMALCGAAKLSDIARDLVAP